WLVRCVNDRGTVLEHLIVGSDEEGSCARAVAGPVEPTCALLREGFQDQGFCRGGKLPFLGYATELHVVRDPLDPETSRAVVLTCDGEEDWDVQDGTFDHDGLERRRVRVDVDYGEDGEHVRGTVTAEWCGVAGAP